jgi:hypothetical protein
LFLQGRQNVGDIEEEEESEREEEEQEVVLPVKVS